MDTTLDQHQHQLSHHHTDHDDLASAVGAAAHQLGLHASGVGVGGGHHHHFHHPLTQPDFGRHKGIDDVDIGADVDVDVDVDVDSLGLPVGVGEEDEDDVGMHTGEEELDLMGMGGDTTVRLNSFGRPPSIRKGERDTFQA